MSVLPLCIDIERPYPVFEPRLDHRDLLSGLVLPAILAAEWRRWHELHNSGSELQEKADKSREKPQSDVSAERNLYQELKDEKNSTSVKSDADKFEISLDVQHFSQEELSVKPAEGYIVVEGKHEEKHDEHGFISRHFMRRYALPEACHPDTVESTLSSDGVLTVTALKKQPALTIERIVPIACSEPSVDAPSTSKQQQEGDQQ